jgi:hypothetical protein
VIKKKIVAHKVKKKDLMMILHVITQKSYELSQTSKCYRSLRLELPVNKIHLVQLKQATG